jgi:FlgD Ig-like domain
VTRYAPAALVAVLLAATGFAFLHTESLKLETSPIRQTHVTKTFSPVCRCDSSRARFAFRLAKPDLLSVSIVDGSGSDVRQLATDRPSRDRVAFLWNGRDDAGQVVADGFYRARVRLGLQEQTFLLPNLVQVDTKRPVLGLVSVRPRVFSPDGDRRSDRITVRYHVDKPARVRLYVDEVQRVAGASLRPTGDLEWYGRVGGASLPARRYALTLAAVDRAGNEAVPVKAGSVRIRYVELAAPVLRASAGGVLQVRVLTDARRVSWRLGSGKGVGKTPLFRIRAPETPGRYRLVVGANGHQSRAAVVVTGP